jgi:hypothetical protein
MHVFASGQGYSSVHGTIAAGQLAPAVYTTSIRTGQEEYEVRMVFSGGNVIDFAAQPPNAPSPDRIPLSEMDRQGVSDPMTASLVWVPGKADTVTPQACERIVSIFEGHMRYDLQLAFRRIERVKSRIGYEGPVVVCSMHFEPIAGHIPDRLCHQLSGRTARYRAVPCADCGDPRLGALSLLSADAARNGDHAGGSIRLHLSIELVLAATGEAARSSHRISITP